MVDLRNTFELLKWVRELSADSTGSLPEWLSPTRAALAAVGAGFVLALWGGRVLRVGFVFLFMAVGAVFGKQFAGSVQVDLLIGLVVGAGLAGLIGYVVYRWCLGLTVAVVAAFLVAATFSAPALLNERQAFDDFRLGVGSGTYTTSHTPLYSWTAVRGYFWERPDGRDVTIKSLGPVALAGLVGFVLSVLAPRSAAILATSLVGSALLAAGAGSLIAVRWPQAWAGIQAHERWSLGVVVFFWLFALMYQRSHRGRPTARTPVAPVPAPAPQA